MTNHTAMPIRLGYISSKVAPALAISRMLVDGSNRRIHSVDDHIGVVRCRPCCSLLGEACVFTLLWPCCVAVQVVTGLAGDSRMLVNRARDECRAYRCVCLFVLFVLCAVCASVY